MADPLFAIDSSVYIFRSYFALEPRWRSRDGHPTEAVYGFAAFLLKLLERERPAYAAAAFDESLGSGFRHRLFPGYKANRALPDENLAFQLAACRQVAEVLGIPTFACAEYEADDYLATMAARFGPASPVYILSRDKDLAQLLDDNTWLWDYGYGEPISRRAYRQSKGLEPALMADFLALAGDAGDTIPGVPGVGPKTATAILDALGGVENWLDDPEKLAELRIRGSKRLPGKIAAHQDQILLSRQLATLRRDLDGIAATAALRWRGIDRAGAGALFEELGLGGLGRRLDPLISETA